MQYSSIKAYSRAAHTVAKTRQVVMLYDGAIRFLMQASDAMAQNAIEARYLKLTRVSEILSGLQNSLDFEAGAQTAQVLFDFYSSIDARVMTLHRQPSVEACQQIIKELRDMRDVWDQIDRAQDGTPAMPPAEAVPTETGPDAPVGGGSVKVSA